MAKLPIHLIVQVVLGLSIGAVSVFIGLVMTGAVGGVAIAVAPVPVFDLVAGSICPEGTLEFSSVQRSFHEPGESEPQLLCVTPDGESQDVLLQGLLSVLGLGFAAIGGATFLIMYLPLAIIAFFLTRFILRRVEAGRRPGLAS